MSIAAAVLPLETVSVVVPEAAVEAYEIALAETCETVGFFQVDEARSIWRVEGVRTRGENEGALVASLALARALSGVEAVLERTGTPAEGWLARTASAFPVQRVGARFSIRGTHLPPAPDPGRIGLVLDAGIAFGSGEHASTRGCLLALERIAKRTRPRRILDLGCGSAILAMAAASLTHRRVRAIDIERWSARVAARNVRANGLQKLVAVRHGDGWHSRFVQAGAPYDLVFANILARPLCRMAHALGAKLAPEGTAILAGLLASQVRLVLAAHRRQGLALDRRIDIGDWTTLVLRRRG